MGKIPRYALQLITLCLAAAALVISPGFCSGSDSGRFSIVDYETLEFHGDYSPPAPPPPVLPPHPPSVSCYDLYGIGSLDTTCKVNSSLSFVDDVYVQGLGNLDILPGVTVSCPNRGCFILVNVSGNFSLGENAVVTAGTFHVVASNGRLERGSVVDVVGLAGEPPAQTSGTPQGVQGAGGGHGGRGANCLTENGKLPDDVWGGDAYSWSSLDEPYSYGSKGGTTSKEEDFGGEGGGRIRFEIENELEVSGSFLADGDGGGTKGGGGSGGSIYIMAHRM